MLKPKLFSFSSLWKPKNVHSLEYLRYLHGVLMKNSVVTDQNRNLLVEVLRSIAEILIWGDQNDASVFDFFLEKNMLGFFLRIMKQKCGSYVCVQLLQTLNILFENINSETSSYYLLSNNNVNSIITHRFDFSDEEILAYYISFLKTLSFKLNPNTIHFFFNEHTGDFPLYTEAIKFFNHSEGMVRIAVRTLTLNVFKVNDSAMLSFIQNKTGAPYFSNLVWFIGNHVVDIDLAVQRSFSSSDSKSRDKLECLVAEHLDHIHYINDILRLGITSLNDMLTDQMLNRLLLPLYLGSLVSNSPGDGPRIRQASALFFISQIFLIITYTPLVEKLACILFLGDKAFLANEDFTFRVGQSFFYTDQTTSNNICNRTDEEKIHQTVPLPTSESSVICSERPWFSALLDSLICSRSDYNAFFALCLLYGIGKNEGISPAVLECTSAPHRITDSNEKEIMQHYNTKSELIDRLVDVIAQCSDTGLAKASMNPIPAAIYLLSNEDCNRLAILHTFHNKYSKVRIVTLDICCEVLKYYSASSYGKCTLSDSNVATLISTKESILQQLVSACQKDDIFLDLFEDELQSMQNSSINVQFVSADSTMLRCPSDTPQSGVEFIKRLPCGPHECVRKAVRVYLILRRCLSDLLPEESPLALATYPSGTVSINDCLNLSNSDMLACTVVQKDNSKVQRFLVTDGLQLLLVEPDSKKVGYGVVRFAGLLQDLDMNSDKEDSRSIFITVHGRSSKTSSESKPLLSSKFIFDDHIRCMAAKQRLSKGRQTARQYKLGLIKQILEIKPISTHSSRSSTPLPPIFKTNCPRVPGHAVLSSSKNTTELHGNPQKNQIGESSTQSCSPYESLMSLKPCDPKSESDNDVHGRRNRRVRVLSSNALERLSDGLENCVVAAERATDQLDRCQVVSPQQKGTLATLNRRCNSLSPRFVARNVSSTPEKNSDPPTRARMNDDDFLDRIVDYSSTDHSGIVSSNIEIEKIVAIEDEPISANSSSASIQCFNNAARKKTTKPYLIHHI